MKSVLMQHRAGSSFLFLFLKVELVSNKQTTQVMSKKKWNKEKRNKTKQLFVFIIGAF
jgi:hypothetical protein